MSIHWVHSRPFLSAAFATSIALGALSSLHRREAISAQANSLPRITSASAAVAPGAGSSQAHRGLASKSVRSSVSHAGRRSAQRGSTRLVPVSGEHISLADR